MSVIIHAIRRSETASLSHHDNAITSNCLASADVGVATPASAIIHHEQVSLRQQRALHRRPLQHGPCILATVSPATPPRCSKGGDVHIGEPLRVLAPILLLLLAAAHAPTAAAAPAAVRSGAGPTSADSTSGHTSNQTSWKPSPPFPEEADSEALSLLQVEQSSRASTAAFVATAVEAASGSVSASGAVAVRNRLSRLGRFEQKRREEERREGGLDLVQPFPSQSLFPTYLWDWFVPESSCADLDRVGRIGDGGKWTCGVQDLARREVTAAAAAGLEEPSCVVFSYGVGPELSFEAELAELAPACVLHVFDPTVPGLAREASRLRQAELLPTHGGARAAGGAADDPGATGPAGATRGGRRRMSFEKVGLAGRSGGIKASGSAAFPWVENLTDAMQRLGTSFIDILKVDVEGAEYDALIPLLERRRPGADPPLFGQLLIELHVHGAEKYASNGTSARNVFRLMHLLHEHGYQIFSKELNLGPPAKHDLPVAIEYSFLHPGAWAARQRGAVAGAAAAPAGARPLRPPPTARRQLSLLAVEGGAPGARVEGGGAIYFVSHAGRLQGLREALLALHEQFNRQFRYPVVVFHENITAAQRRALEAAVTEDLYPLKFMDVSEIWAAAPLPRGRATTPELCRCSSETSTLGYRKMIYFQAFLAHDILSESLGYEWLWRLDDDSRLTAPVGYDPFRLMAANGWRYGTVAAVGDEAACVEGLWELASKFVADAQRKEPVLLPHGPDFFDQMLPGYVFYNNFEISHVSLWQSPVYRRWRDAVLEHGGIFTRRWGDAPIRTIGVAMQMKVPGSGPPRLANSSTDLETDGGELHFFEDIGYQHWPFVSQEPRGLGAPRLQWQLQQQQQQASGGRVQLSSSWHNGTRRKENMMKDPPGRNFVGGGDGAEVSQHLARTTNGTAEGALPAGLLAALDGRYSLAHSVGPMSRMPVVRLPPQALVPLEESASATASLAKLRGSGHGKNSSGGGQSKSLRNGIVYCLISSLMSGRNVSRLLTSLGENFLQSWPYPFVIFFDVEDEAAAREAAAAVQELAARYRRGVQGQEVPCPYQARRLQHGNGTELRYGARIEGAWLPFPVRLWATPFGASLWQVEAQSLRLVDLLAFEERYDWLWRVDVTGEVPEPITLDPFAAMEQRGARYGYNYVVQELESKLQGDLWQKGLDVARGAWAKLRREEQDGQGEADGSSTGEPDGVLLFKNWPKGRIFITSCEVSHASVWSHPAARTLLQHFLRSPDFSKFQWSDAALHTLAVLASVVDHRELWDMTGLPYTDLLVQWRRPRRPGAIEVPPAAAAAASASSPSAPPPPDLRFQQLLLLPQTSQAQVLAEVPVRPVAKLETFGWLGGDVGTSLLLPSPSSPTTGPPQRLWLFGDTLLGTSRRGVRTQLHKVLHHSIGRSPSSRGEDLRKGRQPTFEWGLREDEAGDVESSDVFACSLDEAQLTAPPSSSSSAAAAGEGCFYWPLTGIAVLHRDGAGLGSGAVGLVLVAAKVQKKPGPNNETTDSILGHSVIAVRNPEDHASRWEWSAKEISGPLARYAWAGGLAAADGAPWANADEEGEEKRGGWVYMLGRTTAHEGRRKRTKAWPFSSWRTEGAAVLARAKAKDLLALRLDGVELLTSGNSSGSPWRGVAEGEVAAKELFKPAEAESSLIWAENLGSWLTVGLDEGRGGTAATLRAAQRPEGPWGPAAAVARVPEELLGLGECYAPKLHPVEAAAAAAAAGASSSSAGSATTTVSMSLVCAPIFTDPQELVELPAKAYVPQLAQVELLARGGASSLSSSPPQGRSSLA